MFMNLLSKQSVGSLFCLVCVIGALTPSVAQAGFEWTRPPAATPSAQQAAPVAQEPVQSGPLTPEPDDALPVPVTNVEAAPVLNNEPLVVDNKPTPAPVATPTAIPTAAPTAPPAPVAEKVEEQPSTITPAAPAITWDSPAPATAPAPVSTPAPTPVAKATPMPAPVSKDVIEGFGKDIPLAIALRDIVPAKYAYVFSSKDIAGTKISWRGGKVWQDVLKDAVTPAGLDVSVTDTQVIIFAKQYQSPAPAPMAPIASPAPAESAALPVPEVEAPAPAPTPTADTKTLVAARPQSMSSPENAEPLPLVAAAPDAPAAEKAPVMVAMDMNATRKWQARPGKTLRQTLEAWTKDSNVELNWSTPYDYPINNAFYFDGKFSQAVDSLLSSYGGETPSPKGRLYPNLPEGPSVLMIN